MVKINGVETNADGKTVTEYLAEAEYDSRRIVVELNEAILSKDCYEKTLLKDGDTVEIVTFMGGGSNC